MGRERVNGWYYSPTEGEIALDVTGCAEEQILLLQKEIDAEFTHAGTVEIYWHDDTEWWILTGVSQR